MATNTVILNFGPGIYTKGDPLGRKLFNVTFVTVFKDNSKPTVWSELWRGGALNNVKFDAKGTINLITDNQIGGTTTIAHVIEIGTLR